MVQHPKLQDEPLYVFVHIPRTGGTTLASILEAYFGARLQRTFDDPLQDPKIKNPACLHGHGILDRFADVISAHQNVVWVTFLREPLRSAISMYFHAKSRTKAGLNPAFNDVGIKRWLTHTTSVHEPDTVMGYNHNRFSQWINKCGRNVREFDFIGLTESFDESLLMLFRKFGWSRQYYCIKNQGTYEDPELDAQTIESFQELNSDDYCLYRSAVDVFQDQRESYGKTLERDVAEFRVELASFEA